FNLLTLPIHNKRLLLFTMWQESTSEAPKMESAKREIQGQRVTLGYQKENGSLTHFGNTLAYKAGADRVRFTVICPSSKRCTLRLKERGSLTGIFTQTRTQCAQ